MTLADVTVSSRGILVALDGEDLTILFNTRGFSTADLVFGSAPAAALFEASSFDASSFDALSARADLFLM